MRKIKRNNIIQFHQSFHRIQSNPIVNINDQYTITTNKKVIEIVR